MWSCSSQACFAVVCSIMNVKIDVCNKKSSVRIPGFKYDDFDRAGNLNITKLHSVLDIHRVDMFRWVREHNIPQNVTFIMFGRQWNISKRLYERAAVDYPMVITWWPTNVGRSSADFVQLLVEEATNELLVTCVFRAVAIDLETQRSFTLPDDVRRSALTETADGDKFPAFRPPVVIPERSFSCTVRVRYDDTDIILHSYQAAYSGYMRECASRATAAGFFTKLNGDFAFYTAESFISMHVGESFAGDDLTVTTWEDEANALLLNFVVRGSDQPVCYAKMLLFDKYTAKL